MKMASEPSAEPNSARCTGGLVGDMLLSHWLSVYCRSTSSVTEASQKEGLDSAEEPSTRFCRAERTCAARLDRNPAPGTPKLNVEPDGRSAKQFSPQKTGDLSFRKCDKRGCGRDKKFRRRRRRRVAAFRFNRAQKWPAPFQSSKNVKRGELHGKTCRASAHRQKSATWPEISRQATREPTPQRLSPGSGDRVAQERALPAP